MKTKIMVALLFVLFCLPAFAGTSNINLGSDLVLWKSPLFEFYARMDICDGLYKVHRDEDVPDMRDFRYFQCQGRYDLYMYGEPGATVTLFGGFQFGTEFGYMIIKKLDHNKIWLWELMLFPENQWFTQDATDRTGAYAVYYHPEPDFDEKISSIKWGKWWEGPGPGDQVPQRPKYD